MKINLCKSNILNYLKNRIMVNKSAWSDYPTYIFGEYSRSRLTHDDNGNLYYRSPSINLLKDGYGLPEETCKGRKR